jgi:PAS domain S-box-containing protein
VYWNAAAQDLYGWTPGEAIGRNIAELTVPEVGQDTAADIMAALRDGVSWSGEFPVRRKDGGRFPALVTDAGVYRDGVLVGIIGVSTNLGSALRPLLERSTDAALVLRSDGVVIYASPAVGQLFGWSAEDVIGAPLIPLVHPEDRPVLGRFLGRVLAGPGAHPPVELRVRRGEDWVWAEAALTNLLDDPTVRGVVCNLRVSVRRAAQEQAETHAAQLETALQTRVVIEQAKGFLAGRVGITVDAAFEVLRGYARSHHLAMQEVSRRVVAGDLPPPTA